MKVQINTKVIDGKATTNKAGIIKAFAEFEGKEVTITIERKKKKRSNQQNAYLWGCIYPLIKQGFIDTHGERYSTETIHEMMKYQFNYSEIVNEGTGEIIRTPKSTTTNGTIQQEEYHDTLRKFALDWFGITIPLPNEEILLS